MDCKILIVSILLITQLFFVDGFPKPNDEKKAEEKKDEKKSDNEKKDAAAASAEKKPDPKAESKKPDAPASDATSKDASPATSSPSSVDPAQLANLLSSLTSAANSMGNLPTTGFPNPAESMQKLFAPITPLTSMLQSNIDGFMNIYLGNREKMAEFGKLATDPIMQLLGFFLKPLGLAENANQMRSLGLKAIMDTTDNLAQAGQIMASTVPNVLTKVQRGADGLVSMKPLSFS